MQSRYKDFPSNFWFFLFLFGHTITWSLTPALVRLNLPLDVIEGSIWGQEMQWGYDKNPYLNGWLTGLAAHLSSNQDWIMYVFSQLSVGLCLWAVWKLANELLTKTQALLAVLLLETVQYFHLHAIDFNDNTLELGLWAITIYCFYLAIFSPRNELQKYFFWACTGLFASLALMAKYYTAALLTAMFLFLLSDKTMRNEFFRLPFYLGLAIFFLVITPHIVWLFQHDFITVKYVVARADSPPLLSNHVFFPLQFMWQQFEVFIPAIFLIGFFSLGKRSNSKDETQTLTYLQKRFLYFMAFGPFILTIALSIILGIKLRAGWGMPLLSLWGIALIMVFKPNLSTKHLNGFIAVIFVLMMSLVLAYTFSLRSSTTSSSANFPGLTIAKSLTDRWHQDYAKPLTYVAGSRWIGGNLSFYSKDHPHVFIEWNQARAPWVKVNDLNEKGALFIWEISAGEILPEEVKKRFPRLLPARTVEFSYLRSNNLAIKPIRLGVAILPPLK